MNPESTAERRLHYAFLLAWLVLTGLLFLAAGWEADRQERVRLKAFRGEVADLSQISEAIMTSRLRSYDDTLRVLREAYATDRANFNQRVQWLRKGPLADNELLIVVVDRDGYVAYTDAPNAKPRLLLKDRPFFRFFAEGGKDRFYIDEPALGRVTRRYSVPLARPIYDNQGGFQGVVAISVRQDLLGDFGPSLNQVRDATVTVVTQRGALVTRSQDLSKVQGTIIPPQLLAGISEKEEGVFANKAAPESDGQIVAYQHIEGTPLIVYVTASPRDVLNETSGQRFVLLAGAGFASLLALLLMGVLLQRKRIAAQFIATQHAYLKEAQRIAGMGSWELDLASKRFQWSDEVYRLFGVERNQFKPELENFLLLVVEAERSAVLAEIGNAVVKGSGSIEFCLRRENDGQLRNLVGIGEVARNKLGKVVSLIGTVRDITGQRAGENALRASELHYRTLTKVVPVGIFHADASGRCVYVNDCYCRLTGRSQSQAHGDGWSGAIHSDDRPEVLAEWSRLLNGSEWRPCEMRFVQPDGGIRWVMFEVQAEFGVDGAAIGFVGSVADINERKHAENELRVAATTFQSQEGMVITDARGVILKANRAFVESTGYSEDDLAGQTPGILKSGRHDAAFYDAMWESIVRTGSWQGEIWDRHKGGRIFPKWLTISAVKNDAGVVTNYVGSHTDITERKENEEKIRQLAFFDTLTGLPNRALLFDRLKQTMNKSARTGSNNALLFIDLDHFKTLNDTRGHDKGDLLLQQIADRLIGCVREGDSVTRLGGDEFVVMLTGLSEMPDDAAAQTEMVGEKILATLNQTYRLGDFDYRCTASIGATLFCGLMSSIDDLLKQADLAMYKAKDAGRNTLRFFDPAMEAAVMARSELEADLREGLEKGQFLLYFQAQIVDENTLAGVEALLRWQHHRRGLVQPADFIPLAEETGLIKQLGLWVLNTACHQLADWATRPQMAHLTMAVNVSAQQFRDPGFVEQVQAVLAASGADPLKLKLELTESLLVDNVQDTIEKMSALKARGVGFSLDDFGTGYSSLAYLKRLPIDQLKIDRSFVRDVLTDPNDAVIASTITALAHSLGLTVIAEGVETLEQRNFLASTGCHAYQGYFFSRPLPLNEFEVFSKQYLQQDPVVA